MKYNLKYSKEFVKDVSKLQKLEPKSFKKVMVFLKELEEHPKTGTGKPEPLKGSQGVQWSRRISKKHRLVYDIKEEVVTVLLLSAYGHYDDK